MSDGRCPAVKGGLGCGRLRGHDGDCDFSRPYAQGIGFGGVGVEHPEDRCQQCGRPNVVWFAPSHLWNLAVPDDGILCPVCFIEAAEQIDIRPTAWCVIPWQPSGDGTPGPAREDAPDARCIVRVQVLERVYRAVLALPFNLPQGLCDAIEAMYQSVRLDELQVRDSGGPREARALVERQACELGLWFINGTVSELFLQDALRELHAAVERDTGGETGPLVGLRAEVARAPNVWEQAADELNCVLSPWAAEAEIANLIDKFRARADAERREPAP